METTRAGILVALAMIVFVSGCADNSQTVEADPSKGLEIVDLKATDDTLTPGQQARIVLRLRNHHIEPIQITDLSIINQGQLQVEKQGCNPDKMEAARKGLAPEMVCDWKITAPSEEELGAFESKPMPVNLRLEYESSLVNKEPLKLQFKPLSDIDSSSSVTKTYSNGEVRATMEVENPAPFEGRNIYFSVKGLKPGSVTEGYEFSYQPDVFSGCPQKEDPVVDSKVEFSCRVEHDTEAVRNLFTSISYKYVKTPTLDIEVVNR